MKPKIDLNFKEGGGGGGKASFRKRNFRLTFDFRWCRKCGPNLRNVEKEREKLGRRNKSIDARREQFLQNFFSTASENDRHSDGMIRSHENVTFAAGAETMEQQPWRVNGDFQEDRAKISLPTVQKNHEKRKRIKNSS